MIDHQRGVDVLGAAAEEAAGDVEFGALALEGDEKIVAHQPGRRRQLEGPIGRLRAQRRHPAGDMGRGRASSVHLTCTQAGAIADGDLAQRVGLPAQHPAARRGPRSSWPLRQPPTSTHVARGDQSRLCAGAGEHQQQRLGKLRAVGDAARPRRRS